MSELESFQNMSLIFTMSLGNARELDVHDIAARYPNGIPGGFPFQFYDQSTAQNALKASERILKDSGKIFYP